ncbi:hypothetical protein ACVKN2_001128 [Paenibacillus sp. PvR018]
MNLENLITFCTVAHHKSFNKAVMLSNNSLPESNAHRPDPQ